MLCFTVAVAALLGLAQARPALEKPNIVMLFVDGQASCRARLSFYSLSSALPLHPLSLFCHFSIFISRHCPAPAVRNLVFRLSYTSVLNTLK
jgi:hypothetical protein